MELSLTLQPLPFWKKKARETPEIRKRKKQGNRKKQGLEGQGYFRKILVSIKFVSAILGPEMGAPTLWTPGKMRSFCRKNHVRKIPLFGGGFWGGGGGSADFIFMGARIFLIITHGRVDPCTWVKPGGRFGSFFVLCFLALGGHCLQMLCLPGFGTHANTQNLPHFRAFPASIQEHSPQKCLFFMANAKLPNRPGFALLPVHPSAFPDSFLLTEGLRELPWEPYCQPQRSYTLT